MPAVKDIKSIKVLNSRGDWTIKTYLELDGGKYGKAVVPEGASKGEREAVCLEPEKSIEIINQVIKPAIVGKMFKSQRDFDDCLMNLDGTPNKGKLGGNTTLSVSIAYIRALSRYYDVSLSGFIQHEFLYTPGIKPTDIFDNINITPLFNVLNGGKHARNKLSFQEFMVIPAKKYKIQESLEIGRTVYKSLKNRLEKDGYNTGVGDEGGFAPQNFTVRKALDYIRDSASENYKVGEDVFLGMDVASESFYKEGKYTIPEENLQMSPQDLDAYYANLLKDYPIIYLEDPFYENDQESWQKFTPQTGSNIMISADDLVVTNPKILSEAIEKKLANTVIVKPNQVGTVWETLLFVDKAKEVHWSVVVSHRSGDTEDPFIADLSRAIGADFVKFGAPVRGERTVKFNRLLEMENGF